MTELGDFVELHFPIEGSCLPAQHAYLLYSGIVHIIPEVHETRDIGIHTIAGVLDGTGHIKLCGTQSLKIRLPLNKVPDLYRLAGKRINVGAQHIIVGAPRIVPLQPAPRLWSRLVVIKKKNESDCIVVEPEFFLKLYCARS